MSDIIIAIVLIALHYFYFQASFVEVQASCAAMPEVTPYFKNTQQMDDERAQARQICIVYDDDSTPCRRWIM